MLEKYKKPSIRSRKVKINNFFSNRLSDSLSPGLSSRGFMAVLPCFTGTPGPCTTSTTTSPCTCFPKGTKILVSGGNLKNIESIKSGEKVLSFNVKNNTNVERSVEELVEHIATESEFVIINGTIKVTSNHLLFVNGVWKEAGTVKTGDKLLTHEGQDVEVRSIQEGKEKNDWYDLHINEEEHNYFAEGILAHNKTIF